MRGRIYKPDSLERLSTKFRKERKSWKLSAQCKLDLFAQGDLQNENPLLGKRIGQGKGGWRL